VPDKAAVSYDPAPVAQPVVSGLLPSQPVPEQVTLAVAAWAGDSVSVEKITVAAAVAVTMCFQRIGAFLARSGSDRELHSWMMPYRWPVRKR
jgi:hypothetical protein